MGHTFSFKHVVLVPKIYNFMNIYKEHNYDLNNILHILILFNMKK